MMPPWPRGFLFVLIYLVAPFVISDSSEGCGFPGRPRNGSFSGNALLFEVGQDVTYQCEEGFVLFGPETRSCLSNGTWTRALPECRQNAALAKSALQSATLWNYQPDLAVDGNGDTCSFTPRSGEQRWWQVHLGDGLKVQSVAITISPGSYQKFTIFIIELLEGNKAMYQPCSKFDGSFETKKAVFLCNDGLGLQGQFVYIRDDRDVPEYFGLCEVEVFEYRNETQCGDPEEPLHSTLQQLNANQIRYGCQKGYRQEEGQAERQCIDGIWSGPSPPRCSEVSCSDPSSVKDGFIEVSNFKGKYVYGSLATYHCNPGYILWGNASRLCAEDGEWTGGQPQCKPITCGQPPEVENGHFRLVNGSDTSWRSKAIYRCRSGYRMREEARDQQPPLLDSKATSNDTWLATPTVQAMEWTASCSDRGIWHPVSFRCIFDPMAVNMKEGANYDWTAAFEENGSMKTGTIITIGALGALVFLVIAMVVIFFWQKHSMRPESPASPKISRSSTNQLIADVAKGLAAHLDGPEPHGGGEGSTSACSPYHDCYEIPTTLALHPTTAVSRPFELGGRSAGDGGSEEGNYSSLKALGDLDQEPPYAFIRQPDGRADEPAYSSLREHIVEGSISQEGDGGYESLPPRRPSIYAGIPSSPALAIYESLPRSQSGSSARTHLVGIQSFSRSPSLARPSPPSREAAQGRYPAERGSSPVLYAQVDRSKKRPPVSTAPGETGSGGSPSDNGSTGNASPMDKEPLYATIGHKHKLSQLPPM